ncbi:MAG: hypothetical protein WC412_08965 [Candidatus Omnitrophota bacterium]
MQSIISTLFTILLIYFLITVFFRILFGILRYVLSRSLKQRFQGGVKQQKTYQAKDFRSEEVIDAEFTEIKK